MRAYKTWNDRIADVVRTLFFRNEELKELMLIPEEEKNNIQAFTSRYFLNDVNGEDLLTSEKTRVLYSTMEGVDISHQYVRRKYLIFDIFVKRTERYNATNDGLQARDKMIGQLIREILTGNRYACGIRFYYEDDFDLATKTIGFARHHIVFSYKAT